MFCLFFIMLIFNLNIGEVGVNFYEDQDAFLCILLIVY